MATCNFTMRKKLSYFHVGKTSVLKSFLFVCLFFSIYFWAISFCFFFLKKNLNLLFIYLFRLCQVLVVARGIFLVAACGLLSCGMHVGSSFPTRDWTWFPCIGSTESYPLDHQGGPLFWNKYIHTGIFAFFLH